MYVIDNIDQAIIDHLKENSRESFMNIGKKIKLSESDVEQRVKNLINVKIIKKFTLELNEDNYTSAVVLVSVDSTIDTSIISEKLGNLKGIKTVYEITGKYDIITIISATSIIEINNSIDALRRISGVVDTNTVIILKKVV